MTEYDVAHFQIENRCLIMIPVNSSIAAKSGRDQNAFRERIEFCAEQAGMHGIVIPVWRGYTGKPKFLAPLELHDLLARIEWSSIIKHINCKLMCVDAER